MISSQFIIMLNELLSNNGEYALAMGPGFFRFYAHLGILQALDELSLLKPSHVSGSSAGAMIGSGIAAGLTPADIAKDLFTVKREDIWDMGASPLGLLKGDLFKSRMKQLLPVETFEECKLPFGVAVWDIFGFKTESISSGSLTDAVFGSSCVPLMFAPAIINGRSYYDGGIYDEAGLMALPGVPSSKLIVNIICGDYALKCSTPEALPEKYKDCRLLTLVMEHIPRATPFTMAEMGPVSYHVARLATRKVFSNGHIQQLSMNHWLVYIDGSDITIPPELFPTSTSETAPSTSDNFFSIPLHPISAMPSLPSFPFLEAVRSGSTGNLSTQNLPSIPETVPFESSHASGKRKRSGNDNKKVTSSKNSIDDTTSSSMEVSGDVDEFVDHAPMIEDDTDKSVLQEQALELKQSSYLAVSAFTESTQKQSKQVKPTTKTVASSSRSKINGPVSVKFNDKADMRLNQMKPASTHGNRRLSMRSNK